MVQRSRSYVQASEKLDAETYRICDIAHYHEIVIALTLLGRLVETGLPFMFFYRSARKGNQESEILLDVVEETHEVHDVVEKPIRTNVLIPECSPSLPIGYASHAMPREREP